MTSAFDKVAVKKLIFDLFFGKKLTEYVTPEKSMTLLGKWDERQLLEYLSKMAAIGDEKYDIAALFGFINNKHIWKTFEESRFI